MADKVKSVEQFSSAFHSAIAVEKSKRGLGKMFHEAVITLLNEHPDATADELVTLFRETLTEVENTLQGELKEAFGEDAEAKDLSSRSEERRVGKEGRAGRSLAEWTKERCGLERRCWVAEW